MIDSLHIKNFKSIKELKINPKKINLFIGRPNVGKSNILEAISMLNAKELVYINRGLDQRVFRFRSIGNLFNDRKEAISIHTNQLDLSLKLNSSNACEFIYEEISESGIVDDPKPQTKRFNFQMDSGGKIKTDNGNFHDLTNVNIKPYKFIEKEIKLRNIETFQSELKCPFGKNLMSVIESDNGLTNDLAEILKDYELDLVFIEDDRKFVIQKKQNSRILQLPLELIADTIKRYIFYTVAIKTNSGSTLIFEEPESNSFPPYIVELAENIAASDNQFFITTHSPYILETLFNRCDQKDIAIYHIEYKDHETEVNELASEEVKELIELKGDVFYNLDYFNNVNG